MVFVFGMERVLALAEDLLPMAFGRGVEALAHCGSDRFAGGPALAMRGTAVASGSEEFIGLGRGGLKTLRRPTTGAAGELRGTFAEAPIARLATAILPRHACRRREPCHAVKAKQRLIAVAEESRAVVALEHQRGAVPLERGFQGRRRRRFRQLGHGRPSDLPAASKKFFSSCLFARQELG